MTQPKILGLPSQIQQEVESCIKDDQQLKQFTRIFYEHSLREETGDLSSGYLAHIAEKAYETSQIRLPDNQIIQFIPLGVNEGKVTSKTSTGILIINDDMPFLLSSISNHLTCEKHIIHTVLHPIIDVMRDDNGQMERLLGSVMRESRAVGSLRESYIYFETTALSEEDQSKLYQELNDVLNDVRACVEDWKPMLAALEKSAQDLRDCPPPVVPHEQYEIIAFLDWLASGKFTLLGYRSYQFEDGCNFDELHNQQVVLEAGYGILRDPNRFVWRGADGFAAFTPELIHFLKLPDPLLITKANVKSTVHRTIHYDYVSVKRFNSQGQVIGEHRIIGLFTADAYTAQTRDIPILRRKVARVLEASGFALKSHASNALQQELETYPRDELIQTPTEDLIKIAMGLLSLHERPRPRLFIRVDPFGRFVSVLAYLPRDLYRADLREELAQMLIKACKGRLSMYNVELRDDILARVHYIFGTVPGQTPELDEKELSTNFQLLALDWDEQVRNALEEEKAKTGQHIENFALSGFSRSYRTKFLPQEAAHDITRLSALKRPNDRDVHFYQRTNDAKTEVRLKIYVAEQVIPLSECVPVLENLGLHVVEEFAFEVIGKQNLFIHDFLLEIPEQCSINFTTMRPMMEKELLGILTGSNEDDSFNTLILTTQLTGDQVMILRAIYRYLRQIGIHYTSETVQAALVGYPEITRGLINFFQARFCPTHSDPEQEKSTEATIIKKLVDVISLDDDRILHRFLDFMKACVRVNVWQKQNDATNTKALAFKIHAPSLANLPLPHPYYEIFVYSHRVEGIHLRGGKIARGGLRWSDRKDDYRIEILNLMKAQMVKNSIIVPVGAKGGFYPKLLPPSGPERIQEGIESYKIFIKSILSLTDNLADGTIVPPEEVVRHDGDDPYLVVAADKGTATFSDIANEISADHGFWMGDAFASGGSQGYDHKKLGITARGAWISVLHHFQELDLNPERDCVRAIGVGDMSGDVFGNGMLQSKTIALCAAFDHRHIFIDPNPETGRSWEERNRLFQLDRSSWEDFDQSLISEGGGVWARSLKSIPISSEMKNLLAIDDDSLSPNELIKAILRAPVDLLWMGGIGTYIKAESESHDAAGDKVNDLVRIDAEELRVKIVGEGANLGLTQAARISFALSGGRINTDFIDNSAGVECSDNEVNIKILLNPQLQSGKLTESQREALLIQMSDNVCDMVLKDNHSQNLALSMAQAKMAEGFNEQVRCMEFLEISQILHRQIEGLPNQTQLLEREQTKSYFTRPELSILLAYAKMTLCESLQTSEVLDDPNLVPDLIQAFPDALQETYRDNILTHPLRKELIATKLANQMINRSGICFAMDLQELSGQQSEYIASAFVSVRDLFDYNKLWSMLDSQRGQIDSKNWYGLNNEAAYYMKHYTDQMLRHNVTHARPSLLVERLHPTLVDIKDRVFDTLRGQPLAQVERYNRKLEAMGATAEIRDALTRLMALDGAIGILLLATELPNVKADDIIKAYIRIGEALHIDWIGECTATIETADNWERMLLASTRHEFEELRINLIRNLIAKNQSGDLPQLLESWVDDNQDIVDQLTKLATKIRESVPVTVAKLAHLSNQFQLQINSVL